MAGPNLARKTARLLVLRREIERIRRERSLTDEKLEEDSGVSADTLRRLLDGETRRPRKSTVNALLNALGVQGGKRAELYDLAMNPGGPSWLHTYEDVLPEPYQTFIGFEDEASDVRNFQLALVPGLLQTEAYTEALIRAMPGVTEQHVRRQLEVRSRRRAVLSRTPPQRLHVILDEAVLRRPVGGPGVMAGQLAALAEQPNHITIRVVPYSAGGHPAGTGPFVIMQFPELRAVFVESMAGQLFVESDVDLERYDAIWGRLETLALNREDSAAFIVDVAGSIE